MPNQRAKRKPTFHAQAILIVLPLLVLVAVGAWSLRQDRLLAEQEARDHARQLAERLLPELTEAIAGPHSTALASARAHASASNTAFGAVWFQISQSGRLLKPAPIADPLPRPLDPAELDPVVAEIWHTARRAEFRDSAADTALTSYRLFLDQSPPDDFAASARMSVALIEAQRGRKPEALEQLRTLLTGNPGHRDNTGLLPVDSRVDGNPTRWSCEARVISHPLKHPDQRPTLRPITPARPSTPLNLQLR